MNTVLDCLGKPCPAPVIELARAIGTCEVGASLVVLADDPAAAYQARPSGCRPLPYLAISFRTTTTDISYYLLTSNYGIPAAVSPPPIHSTSVLIPQRLTPKLGTITHRPLRKLVMGDKNLQRALHRRDITLCRNLSPMTSSCSRKLSWVTNFRIVSRGSRPLAGRSRAGGRGGAEWAGDPSRPSARDHIPPYSPRHARLHTRARA